MKQLQAALSKAVEEGAIDKTALPPGKKKPKRPGRRSTGEITLRALRLLLIAQAVRLDRHKQLDATHPDEIFDALVTMFGEVSERLEEYETEREPAASI